MSTSDAFDAAARDLDAYVKTLDAGEALGEAEHIAATIEQILATVHRAPALQPAAGPALTMLAFTLGRLVRQYVRRASIIPTPVTREFHACSLAVRMAEAAIG